MSPVTASSACRRGLARPSRPRASRSRVASVPLARGCGRARAPSASSSDAAPSSRTCALRERPGREVDVRVGEAGKHAAAAEVDDVRARQAPTRGCRRRPRSARRRSRARAVVGSDAIHRADDAVLEDQRGDSMRRKGADDRRTSLSNVSEWDRAKRFYEKLLGTLGYRLVYEADGALAYFADDRGLDFGIGRREPIGGAHVAFACPDRDAVDAIPRGCARRRWQPTTARREIRAQYDANYYAAYVLDPDGNNIEGVCHNAPTRIRRCPGSR